MLGIGIENYEDFQKVFGGRKRSGRIINKILLSFWKHRFKIDGNWSATQIKSMDDLYELVISNLCDKAKRDGIRPFFLLKNEMKALELTEYDYPDYDRSIMDFENIRVKKVGKHVMVTPGRIFRDACRILNGGLPDDVITYCSERFTAEYRAQFENSNYELHVDDNFQDIYTSSKLSGNFGSCMNDRDNYSFYQKLDAKAAYLKSVETGLIAARCILYTKVYREGSDKTYRYAERQYSDGNQEILKHLLVSRLIKEGYIDMYKTIGAGVSEITAIRDLSGGSIENPRFYIKCDIGKNDRVSYMDTFRYYYPDHKIAANFYYEGNKQYTGLATTAGHI